MVDGESGFSPYSTYYLPPTRTKDGATMRRPFRVQCLEFRSVFMLLVSELVLLLTFSAMGLWVVLRAAAR